MSGSSSSKQCRRKTSVWLEYSRGNEWNQTGRRSLPVCWRAATGPAPGHSRRRRRHQPAGCRETCGEMPAGCTTLPTQSPVHRAVLQWAARCTAGRPAIHHTGRAAAAREGWTPARAAPTLLRRCTDSTTTRTTRTLGEPATVTYTHTHNWTLFCRYSMTFKMFSGLTQIVNGCTFLVPAYTTTTVLQPLFSVNKGFHYTGQPATVTYIHTTSFSSAVIPRRSKMKTQVSWYKKPKTILLSC